jgi:hypothetical protein
MMKGAKAIKRFGGLALAVALSLPAASAIAQAAAIGTGAFPKATAIEGQLKRGVSTRADVQRVLGVPNGGGGALLPGVGARSEQLDAYQLWYYEDIEITEVKSQGEVMNMKMRQQILAVFFKDEVFHGYFWTSNAGAAQAVSQ